MTAFGPGASPPPVKILTGRFMGGPWRFIVACRPLSLIPRRFRQVRLRLGIVAQAAYAHP